MAIRLVLAVLGTALATLAAACDVGGNSGQAPGGLIRIDGSSTIFPIAEAVAEEFQKKNRDVRVTVGISGTGGGFQRFCRGESDITNASRPIQAIEAQACEKAGITFTELPVAYDGLAVLVHPNNSWVDHLTVAELEKIWAPESQGKVMTWSYVRQGWPDRELHLYGPGVDSGTYDYFTEAINGKAGASRGDFTASEDDNVLVQGVAGDENALGFLGYAYYEQNRNKLKIVAVDDGRDENGKGPITPSPETVRNGTYQPLSRLLFIYVSHQALERQEVTAFVDYYLEEGGWLINDVGSIQLGDRGYEVVREQFAKRTPGTLFAQGGSQVAVTIDEWVARQP